MKHNDWTEQLRQRLNDAEVPAPENLWDSISQQLDTQANNWMRKANNRMLKMLRLPRNCIA